MEEYLLIIMEHQPVYNIKDLSYDYPGQVTALRNINFSIFPGEFVALLGVNGSGKSTLLKLLDGLIFPTDGEIQALGKPLSETALQDKKFNTEFRHKVGMVFQDPEVQLFSSTVWEEVIFGPLQLRIPEEEVIARGEEVLKLMNLAHLRDRPPYLLSGGEKKKVALASVLSLHPQALLLDEPTNGLDPYSQGNLIDFLLNWSDKTRCLIFSTQDLDIVEEIATRIIVIGNQHNIIADGDPGQFLYDPDFLLRNNLSHEHSHRHKELVHRHSHLHEHQHHHDN
jgi:cobalt/nickel transport system ATP-binding protein